MAEKFFWAKGQGCTILNGQCSVHGHSCSTKGQEGCFYDYTFQSTCTTDNFSNSCNFQTGTNFDKDDCRYMSNADSNSNALGESFGMGARCFEGKLAAGWTSHGNMCYRAQCFGNWVEITIAGKKYNCMTDGQKITPSGFDGYVKCPKIKDFCDQWEASCKDDCNMNGRCLADKTCWCYNGFSGATCNTVDNTTAVDSGTSTGGSSNTGSTSTSVA